METVIRNIGELNEVGRSAAETLVGHSLDKSQQLVIQIIEREATAPPQGHDADNELPSWCDVYAGLSEDQIAELERAISRRLDLSRSRT